MWLGSGQQLKQVDINDIPLLSTAVQLVDSARDLGAILDSRLGTRRIALSVWGPIYKISYDDLTIILR